MSRKIGALWIKEYNGKKYMSGVLQDFGGDINIAVFKNDKKEKENQPDYHIVISEKKSKTQDIQTIKDNGEDIPADDLPF